MNRRHSLLGKAPPIEGEFGSFRKKKSDTLRRFGKSFFNVFRDPKVENVKLWKDKFRRYIFIVSIFLFLFLGFSLSTLMLPLIFIVLSSYSVISVLLMFFPFIFFVSVVFLIVIVLFLMIVAYLWSSNVLEEKIKKIKIEKEIKQKELEIQIKKEIEETNVPVVTISSNDSPIANTVADQSENIEKVEKFPPVENK